MEVLRTRARTRWGLAAWAVWMVWVVVAAGAAPVAAAPSTRPGGPDYLGLVRAYADAMVDRGRDTYGAVRSPLFASALDRRAFTLGSAREFGDIPGVRPDDRSIGGANPNVDAALFQTLYRLSDLTADRRYAREADAALTFFLTHCQSPGTGLLAWGEHLYWDFQSDRPGGDDKRHEVTCGWPLWARCYELNADACWAFAIGQWDHQIADKQTGDFSRHAQFSRHGPQRGADFPRYAGQMILDWATAYAHPSNAQRPRRAELLTAIELMVSRMESNTRQSEFGILPAQSGADFTWPSSNLELARCLTAGAPSVPEALRARMLRLAIAQDQCFHRLAHRIDSGGGFVTTAHTRTGEPRSRSMNKPYSESWASGYGYGTHAEMAAALLARYRQVRESHPELAARHRGMVVAAADCYLKDSPPADALLKPDAFASVVNLLLDARELSGEARYLARADEVARLGVGHFLTDDSPLPRATSRHNHYETITGGPALMQALVRLHEALSPPANP